MWFKEISTDSDVVISSRIRYARNIQGFKFPNAINNEDIEKMENLIHAAVSNKYKIFKLKDIDEITKCSLVEQHIISKEFLYNEDGMFACSEDYKLVMMVNEEDHLRIQAFESGLNIKKCYDNISNFTKEIQNKISFSKTDDYGYLTSCPTNVGSGMRVSVMMHLPALYKRGLLNKLFDQAATIGVSIRGLYGENTSANGNIYQISNKKL